MPNPLNYLKDYLKTVAYPPRPPLGGEPREVFSDELNQTAPRPGNTQVRSRTEDIELSYDILAKYLKDPNFPAEDRLVGPEGNSYTGVIFTPAQELRRVGLSREDDIKLPIDDQPQPNQVNELKAILERMGRR